MADTKMMGVPESPVKAAFERMQAEDERDEAERKNALSKIGGHRAPERMHDLMTGRVPNFDDGKYRDLNRQLDSMIGDHRAPERFNPKKKKEENPLDDTEKTPVEPKEKSAAKPDRFGAYLDKGLGALSNALAQASKKGRKKYVRDASGKILTDKSGNAILRRKKKGSAIGAFAAEMIPEVGRDLYKSYRSRKERKSKEGQAPGATEVARRPILGGMSSTQ
jgi:hypothetical protein